MSPPLRTDAPAFQALRILPQDGWPCQQIRIALVGGEQTFDFALQIGITLASLRQKRAAGFRPPFHHGFKKVANLPEPLGCHRLHVPNSAISG